MSATENYIGFEELVFYLNEPRKISYHGFLKIYRNTIIASLSQLTNFPLEKWQNFNITWVTRFLHNAKKLFDSNTFTDLKKKVNAEYLQRKKDLQIYWQEVIKEYEESQKIIKEYEKENMITTVTPLPKKPIKVSETLQSKENTFTTATPLPKKPIKFSETSQLDLSKKNITFINDFCYDVFHELENESYANLFYKYTEKDVKNKVIEYPMDLFTINSKLENNQYTSLKEFEKDIRLIFCNCYTYNDIKSKEYCSGKILESIFNEKWNEKIIIYDRQTRELKRVKDNDTGDTDDTDRSWKKQCQILEQNKNNLIYRQVINDALLIASAYESLVIGNIIPFIEILKTFLLTRSRMSLSLANESMLQAIIESLLPLKYRIPELSLVMDGKKLKGSGRFGYSDIFVLKGIGDIYYISLELKYIPLVGLIKNQKVKYGANELENLDKILEKENEEDLLKRPYAYWSKEHKRTNQTTIGEVLNSGISQLESYMNTISKGRVVDYSSSGIFDERVKIVKSNPNKLKGFVILVIGFRRILWKPVDEVISNYTYNII
ncbi:unnamed protein product [Rhizophagus irregularis]|uniref:Bromo domain-containing protein n=1 Tax=Rhizophagus irregularis TaxID=588596 RepID=A0A915YRX6_9GLOM|nr:unnamed protein product [Rhizophagus irregularis]CAB5321780.1 unnamed protein product [Rhizophagus irregularis]